MLVMPIIVGYNSFNLDFSKIISFLKFVKNMLRSYLKLKLKDTFVCEY